MPDVYDQPEPISEADVIDELQARLQSTLNRCNELTENVRAAERRAQENAAGWATEKLARERERTQLQVDRAALAKALRQVTRRWARGG